MPLYPFRCDHCGLEFEVSRKMSQASDPAPCPMDGEPGVRIFTAPVRLTSGRGDSGAPPASGSGGEGGAPGTPGAPGAAGGAPARGGFSHFGHSHGFGAGSHSHGGFTPPPRT